MCAIELERKFLVAQLPPQCRHDAGTRISQGYLVIGTGGSEVRVRRRGDHTVLTVKKGTGLVRREEEIEIPRADFERLWPLTEASRIEKRRHEIALDGELVAELDVYEGPLAGLLVAEVEFPNVEAAERFAVPEWFGPEVTEDDAYKNRRLATDGLPGGS